MGLDQMHHLTLSKYHHLSVFNLHKKNKILFYKNINYTLIISCPVHRTGSVSSILLVKLKNEQQELMLTKN